MEKPMVVEKKQPSFKELSDKEYAAGDLIIITGVVGNKDLVCQAEIIEVSVFDDLRSYVVKTSVADNRNWVYWFNVRGYVFDCPECGMHHAIPGTHKALDTLIKTEPLTIPDLKITGTSSRNDSTSGW